jgi:ankyrin repeat protein
MQGEKIIKFLFSVTLTLLSLSCFPQADTVIHTDTTTNIVAIPSLNNDSILKIELNEKLLEAAEQGKVDDVLALLLKGADANAHNYDGVSALMYASQNGFLDVVKVLVYNGANMNAKPWDGSTALIAATRFNHDDIMDYLIQQGADMNSKDKDSCTALFYAAVYGYFIPADMLIFYGADIKCRARDSSDALIAASFYGATDVAQLLIRKGADINSKDQNGWTPLHSAVFGNHLDIVKMLVDTGATIDVKNSDGYTPLAIASENGYQQIVDYLLEKKANASIYTNAKATPLILSLYNSHYAVSKKLKSQAVVKKEWKPFFNSVNFCIASIDVNKRDFMYGLYAGIQDIRYMTGLRLGYNTRLWADRILLPVTDTSFYQLWERRSFFFLEAEKIFRLNTSGVSEKGIFIALKELYTYGKYQAMNQKPDGGFTLSPSAGLVIYDHWGGIRFAYEYMKFKVKDFPPHRFNVSLFINIPIHHLDKTSKNFYWL